MKKEDLRASFDGIEPSDELVQNVKMRMLRGGKRKRSVFLKLLPAMCTLVLVCAVTLAWGLSAFQPAISGVEVKNSGMFARMEENIYAKESVEARTTYGTDEARFEYMKNNLPSKNISFAAVTGKATGYKLYISKDSARTGIHAYAVISFKVYSVSECENAEIKGLEYIPVIVYFDTAEDLFLLGTLTNGAEIFIYSDENMIPHDLISDSLGVSGAYAVFDIASAK